MALGVDLFGLDIGGAVIWRRMCRWDGFDLLKMFADRLRPADPAPSWECTLTDDEVKELAEHFEPADFRSRFPDDPDLTTLLQTAGTKDILLRIEEWGYG